MRYRIRPNPRLNHATRKALWRRMLGHLPMLWNKGRGFPCSEEELHALMTRIYDPRRGW